MTTRRSVTGVALAIVLAFASATPALAGTCFCNIERTGATETSGASDARSCQTLCAGNSRSQGYLWAEDPSQFPSSLLQCFSKKELCEKDMNEDEVEDGTFDSKQPPECPPGWHYCYPNDTETYELQVSIPSADGPVTSVYNYGEYVGVVYKYLVGFAVTIAIVFLMIGGIRYVIGASTGEIGKAKDMIVKAITGLVLLMFAYVILYTVNPELVKLQVPKLPMLRRVDILTGGETCNSLIKAGYEVDTTTLKRGQYSLYSCGTVGEVVKKPDGSELTGTTCMFSTCANGEAEEGAVGAAQCVSDGTKGWCVTCNQIVPGNDYNITPTAGLCSALDPEDTYVNLVEESPAYDKYKACGYTHDPSMFSSGLGATAAVTATALAGALSGGTAAAVVGGAYTLSVVTDAITGSCVSLDINCQQVNTCADYNSSSWQVANTITDNELVDLSWPELGDPNIVEICAADPCGVRTVEGKSGETCEYYDASDTSQLGVSKGCFEQGHTGEVDYDNYPAGP